MNATWLRGRPIGRGSFGAVSLAFRSPSGEAFAVKSVSLNSCSPDAVRSLESEIDILRSLSSPHVVEYLGDDETRELLLGHCRNLHMEYLPGGTAADLAAAGKDEAAVRDCARCVARALAYLHGVAGVVHCDVKGRNVLLGRSPGVAKLADFGAALRVSDASDGRNWFRGTPLWMAPEVVRGERPTPASDIWSLGCTVIEMATGARPWPCFGLADGGAAMFEIGYGTGLPEFPASLSKVGWDFLDKCLRRDAGERWTAEQLLQHPFLAEANVATTAVAEKSPRSVLDWANSEFCDDGVGESCNTSYIHVSVSCASERVKGLASEEEGIHGWDSVGWDVVRCAEEPNLVRNQEQDQQQREEEGDGICEAYPSCCNGGQKDWVDGVVPSIAASCSAASLRYSCCNCCSSSSSSSLFFCCNKQQKWLLSFPPAPVTMLLELLNLFLIWSPMYFTWNLNGKNCWIQYCLILNFMLLRSCIFYSLAVGYQFLLLSSFKYLLKKHSLHTYNRPSNPRGNMSFHVLL